jgi:hypothetical protein
MALRACRRLIRAIDASREEADDENQATEEFTMADEDKIMTHLLECLGLLADMQSKEQHHIPANIADAWRVRKKVFMAALTIVGESVLETDEECPVRTNAAVDQLLEAFHVPTYRYRIENGRNGWLPLHWAVVLMASSECSVTEADVKTLYALDPMVMQTKHVDSVWATGFMPAHLLCMGPVTPCSMQLVRSFLLCIPAAFVSATTVSGLHAACRFGTPTVELLQLLLQLDSSQAKVKASYDTECYPLGLLCFNLVKRADELPNAEDLVNCLLEVDKSEEVVGEALFTSMRGYSTLVAFDDETPVDWMDGRLY